MGEVCLSCSGVFLESEVKGGHVCVKEEKEVGAKNGEFYLYNPRSVLYPNPNGHSEYDPEFFPIP